MNSMSADGVGKSHLASWLGIPAGKCWLDVGCGTGALCGWILEHCSPFSVLGVDPSEGFLERQGSICPVA